MAPDVLTDLYSQLSKKYHIRIFVKNKKDSMRKAISSS